ncbi:MAG: SRPBCC family protein [Bacteroidota bacterium]
MTIESNKVIVNKSPKELFDFLAEFKNFEQLMPSEVQKFEADETSFVFGIKGMPEIRLIKKSSAEYSQIILEAASSKLPVELIANLEDKGDNKTETQLIFNGEFNPMIKMMVQKPLKKFIETLSENIEKL